MAHHARVCAWRQLFGICFHGTDCQCFHAQAFELGAAKWEFENARKAFGDTMRKFAPGGGAGHFLANAIARRTDRVRLSLCTI